MSTTTREGRPRFTGVSTYQDSLGRFSFRFPSDWQQFDLAEDLEGVMFSPEADDPQTYFAVWVSKLDDQVVAEDLDTLREGTEAGLEQLANCEVEARKDDLLGNLVKLERIYTFDEGGVTRKRRVWTLYVDTWRIVLVWQGSTPQEYAYWLPMGNYSFATFEIPEALWFATDRDLQAFG
ncbi:PsbP-related protein [Actinopolymorpha alba]|uniref:PsbP-related protein n=1 Tax=Actinopolymorpha alba TaxID=533267 RepID=UPI00036F91A5|nr:PsbP-related protein [Actinopolymorpha alba]